MGFFEKFDALAARRRRIGGGIRILYLRENGERARLRFVTEPDDGVAGFFHVYEKDAEGRVLDPIPCLRALHDDGEFADVEGDCPYCEAGKRPRLLAYFWVWVYSILHPNQNERAARDPSAQWTPVRTATGQVLYEQPINAIKILQVTADGVSNLRTFLEGYGTLLDRDYTIVRNGGRGDPKTVYTWISHDPTPPPAEMLEAIKSIPPLKDEVVVGPLRRMYAGDEQEFGADDLDDLEEL